MRPSWGLWLCGPRSTTGRGETGLFLETAHPAKFTPTMEEILGKGEVPLPPRLAAFMEGEKHAVKMDSHFPEFRKWLSDNCR